MKFSIFLKFESKPPPMTPPKNRKRGLVDYDTESSSSTGSSGKTRTPSKREKFLAKKASRLKALGNIEDVLSKNF